MANKTIKFLKEWCFHYIKNKDLILNKLITIDIKEDRLEVKYKDKEQVFLIKPEIKDIDKFSEQFTALVTLNTKENLEIIIKNWDKLKKYPKLSIYFVNPFSALDKVWIIFPRTHNLITEKSTLKSGLNSLSQNVDVFTKEDFKKI